MRSRWIVWYAVALHATWGALLLVQPEFRTTSLGALFDLFGSKTATAIALLGVAGFATWAVIRAKGTIQRILALLPQQFVLLLSAAGAITAVIEGHFADGVPRPHAFIFADQAPIVYLAVLHGLFVLRQAWRPK